MTGQQAVPLFGVILVAIGALLLMIRDYKLKKKKEKKTPSSSKSSGSNPRPKRVKRRR